MTPKITRIECTEFEYDVDDIGRYAGSKVYDPDSSYSQNVFATRICSDIGIAGEYIAPNSPSDVPLAEINMTADHLIGKNPLYRERHWSELKQRLRKYSKMGIGPIDIALWDFAGKYHDAPIHKLLGSYRDQLPTYASTYHADDSGGLDTPEAYADFAEECLEKGYPAFKMHGFPDYETDIELVHVVGERVGDKMDLMLDASCKYETFSQALKVGKACDEQDFLWYEDPYRDGGTSQHGHRKLRQLIDTPLLQGEMVRSVESHADFVATESTDYIRADPEYDGGITGAIKIARIAEGFGIDVEYHAPCPARRHCMAATRNSNYYELGLLHPKSPNRQNIPAYKGDYSEDISAVNKNGAVTVPEDPGLGVEIDWDFIESNKVREKIYS